MASSIGLALRQALLLLLHALDLLLSAVARLFARRPAFSASRTKPPPHHVELLLVDDDPQSTMASVQLAVNWARDQGVSDLSVFVPKDRVKTIYPDLLLALSPRPPTPPSSRPSTAHSPCLSTSVEGTSSIRTNELDQDAGRAGLGWEEGWRSIHCGSGTAEVDSGSSATPVEGQELRSRRAVAERDVPRRSLQLHLLTSRACQPLLTRIALSFASSPSSPAVDEITPRLVSEALSQRLPCSKDPDLLIIHRSSCQDLGWGPWDGEGSVRLHGVGVWGLRVTEIYQTKSGVNSKGGLNDRHLEGALEAWRAVEQRYGK